MKQTSNDALTIYEVNGIKENIEPLFASEYYPYYAVTQPLNFIKYKKGNIIENSIEIVNNDTCDNLFNMEDYHFCLGERNKRRRKNCSRDKGKAFYLIKFRTMSEINDANGKSLSDEERINEGEDPQDMGGYFILNGNERVLIKILKLLKNYGKLH